MRATSEHVPAWLVLLGLVAVNGYNIALSRRSGEGLAGDRAIAVALVVVAELLALTVVWVGWNHLTQIVMGSRRGQAIRHQGLWGALSLWIGGTGFVVQTAMVLLPLPSSVINTAVGLIAGGACVLALILRLRSRGPGRTTPP